ncbi:hypothetical protein ACIBO5_56095 [Nonomuraea angiospora]|uniref:hypothetical protein n=1 Tax=Nonomuraea angiospora TaxID=46172 RepID=UPI0029A1DB08|nr:hypothetical protein [Nonomuraea angiospora]MDX3104497.1 hypothetical protein [Nonomuraea angiospora]
MPAASSNVPDLESTSEREIVDLRGRGPFVSLGRYHYLTAHEPLPEQRHDHLLVLVRPLRGRTDVVLDGRVVTAGPGQVLRIRPGTGYRIGTGAQPRGDLLWLILRTDGDTGPVARVLDELGRAEHDLWPVPQLSVDLLCRALASPAGGAGWLTAAWREALCAAAVIDLIRGSSGPEAGVTVEHPGLRRALRW